MADVTDCAFRQIINKYGKPDAYPPRQALGRVFWTEFVSADGLAHEKGREKLLIDLRFSKDEHPIVAQIFGSKEENMRKAAELCRELGFDGIDINMGCPDKAIEKQGCGSGMIKDPENAKAMIRAVREGAQELPVSVKTRIGYNKNEINTWIRGLLQENLAMLTVHLRTRKEMSDVPARWDLMTDIIKLRDEISPETLIIGNGDVLDIDDGRKKCKETGCDGVMLGRAIFGNPWLFAEKIPTLEEKLKVAVEHTHLFQKLLGKVKNFDIMKKHFKAYVNGFDGAKELRVKLMETKNAEEVEEIISNFLKTINAHKSSRDTKKS